jgi:hypothetical protein
MSAVRHALAASLAVVAVGSTTAAARSQAIEPEARVDAIVAHRSAIQGALGADIRMSPELHLELAAGAGPSFGGGGGPSLGARGDAIFRFLIDPRHVTRWSPYGGGGIGARYDGSRSPEWRAVAILVVGANGPKWKHMIPFVEAGLGGGVRLGMGVRRER